MASVGVKMGQNNVTGRFTTAFAHSQSGISIYATFRKKVNIEKGMIRVLEWESFGTMGSFLCTVDSFSTLQCPMCKSANDSINKLEHCSVIRCGLCA